MGQTSVMAAKAATQANQIRSTGSYGARRTHSGRKSKENSIFGVASPYLSSYPLCVGPNGRLGTDAQCESLEQMALLTGNSWMNGSCPQRGRMTGECVACSVGIPSASIAWPRRKPHAWLPAFAAMMAGEAAARCRHTGSVRP
jgi:hypothetical protein